MINTARGAVVDDDALIAALTSESVCGGLDVFNGEPNIDPRYRELDNTFPLPHRQRNA